MTHRGGTKMRKCEREISKTFLRSCGWCGSW